MRSLIITNAATITLMIHITNPKVKIKIPLIPKEKDTIVDILFKNGMIRVINKRKSRILSKRAKKTLAFM